ncbi:MAG: tyrosine-protein phosphatase [Bacteroidales bacterium]|nr:tyrosine-protein phosphatase [Bacteroidales bacterium]
MNLSQHNFRDLGGIPTLDGLTIRKGLLFRSGELRDLSEPDLQQLENINLSMVIDLRSQREIDRDPDKTIRTVKSVVRLNIYDGARDKSEKFIEENNSTAIETVLEHDYRRMVNQHLPEFRKFLNILATTEDLPLVYHCAAGKDRTGLSTVFLLTALNVSMDQIRDDYLETNKRVAADADRIIRKFSATGGNGEILRPLLEARESYLLAALDEINIRYGGLGNYVSCHLQADEAALKRKYLN